MRIEKDFLGEKSIPKDVLYGIHSARAVENFPDKTIFPIEWYKAVGLTKLACYLTYKKFKIAAISKLSNSKSSLIFIDDEIIEQLILSAREVSNGVYYESFIVPAIQGGAGTSINMNVNEIIANSALMRIGKKCGEYSIIDPVEQANIYQSTNDVIPTSLTLSVIILLSDLEENINKLRSSIEQLEVKNRDILRIAYTQMQEAVPSSYGKLFSTYSDALSRDWWRVSKCFERIKTVNLGGSAIGTSLTVPRFFVMEVVNTLQLLTSLPLTRGENLSDATNNVDKFVEVHAILKAHAVNLEKIVSDLRLLSSDLVIPKDIVIPNRQVGSSIMPGKINPVIPEFVISIAHKVYSNDLLITSLAGLGCLDLNAYIPTIGYSIIESIKLLIAADKSLKENLIDGLQVNIKTSEDKIMKSSSITTALLPFIGYHNASLLAKEMKSNDLTIFEANLKLKLINEQKLIDLLKPQNLLKSGFSLNDLVD
jgi:aspartate ammonia-lyase